MKRVFLLGLVFPWISSLVPAVLRAVPPAVRPPALILFVSQPTAPQKAALFIRSIRRFGGEMKDIALRVMNDAGAGLSLEPLKGLGAAIHDFETPPVLRDFPFASKVSACAAAERPLADQASILLYFDTEMIGFSSSEKLLVPADFRKSQPPDK